MKTLTVTQAARNFNRVVDAMERDQEEVLLVRNKRHVVRLVPEPAAQNALEVLGDLCGSLDDGTATALSEAIGRTRRGRTATLVSLRNPWDS
jgi:PHD/YefM family antitoxin component YafN of YafNO toxin-antitoxin module